ncbi:MAG: hypothetical protein WCO06_06250 [Candidatus Roizmanbacteria bacterium]
MTLLHLTPETISNDSHKWLLPFKYHESGTVIQFQNDTLYRIPQIIQDTKTIKQVLGQYYRRFLMGQVLVENRNLIEVIKENLHAKCIDRLYDTENKIKRMTVAALLDFIDKKGVQVCLFITHTRDLFIDSDRISEIYELEHLLRTHRNLSVVLFTSVNITDKQYIHLRNYASSLYSHISIYPLYSIADCNRFISYNCTLWDIVISDTLREKIIRESGGYLWLIRQVLRYYRDNPKSSSRELFNHPLLREKVQAIYNRFTDDEKVVLNAVHTNKYDKIKNYSGVCDYLLKVGFLQNKSGVIMLGVPLISLALEAENNLQEISMQGKEIVINGRISSHLFTEQEFRILSLLIQQRNLIVSREQVADMNPRHCTTT